jgi:hypothetical protein
MSRCRNISPGPLLEHELVQEKASALGRLGRALESRLAAIAAFDAEHRHTGPGLNQVRRQRAVLVQEASLALWQFAIQREACGMRDLRHVLRHYRVPPEVVAQMGVVSPRSAGPG